MKYEIEVFASGTTLKDEDGKRYRIRSRTFRAPKEALDDWYAATDEVDPEWYGSQQHYLDAVDEAKELRRRFREEIAEALGWKGKEIAVSRVFSDIFTAVLTREVKQK